MSEEEKDAERLTEVEENESEPPSPSPLESDQSAIEAKANVAEDQELKVLPETGEENQKEIIVAADAAKKSLPRATTTDKRIKQKQRQQYKEPNITNVSKRLEQQTTEIKKIKSMVQSQPGLIKQLQSQLKQLQKQISQIQKYVTKQNKKKK
jgi:hypothetical protein